jgi:hypothetical protein
MANRVDFTLHAPISAGIMLRQREEWIRFSYSNKDTKDEERRRAGSSGDD